MNKHTLAALVAGAALAAFAAGCSDDTHNANNANNANRNTNANNTAVNTNANSNTAIVTNTNSRNYNANISRADWEREKDRYAGEAKSAGDSIGQGVEDGWLWVKAKGALAAVDDLRDSTINVDVDNGVVTLRGTVESQDQVKKADTAVKGIEGEKSVKNMLKVSADGGSNKNGNTNTNAKKG